MTCVTRLVAWASPAASEMPSRRSRMLSFEQPASAAASSAAPALIARRDDMAFLRFRQVPLRQVEDVAGQFARRDASGELGRALGDFGLAHQEQIDIVRRQRRVEWRLDDV